MNHHSIKQSLSAFYDGELSENERQDVQAHIGDCAECRVFLENLAKISKGLSLPKMEPSEFFVQSVMNRVKAQAAPASRRIFPVQWLAPSFGIAAMLLLALMPSQHLSTDSLLDLDEESVVFVEES